MGTAVFLVMGRVVGVAPAVEATEAVVMLVALKAREAGSAVVVLAMVVAPGAW